MRPTFTFAAMLTAAILFTACSRNQEPADTAGAAPPAGSTAAAAGTDSAPSPGDAGRAASSASPHVPTADAARTADPTPASGQAPAAAEAIETPLPVDDSMADVDDLHTELDTAMRRATPAKLWAEWDRIRAGGNQREMDMLTIAFGDRLRERPDLSVVAALADRLADPMTDYAEAVALVQVLELAASAASLSALLDYLDAIGGLPSSESAPAVEDDATQSLRARVLDAIGNTVQADHGSGPNWALSPVLEAALREATPERPADEVTAVALGLASLSAPSGTQALLEAAATPQTAGTDIGGIARKAVSSLERIDAVPALRDALADPALPPEVQTSALDGLISIGRADAAIAIVHQLTSATAPTDAQLVQLETALLSRDLPRESLKVIDDALQNALIDDPRVMQLLERVLEAAPADWQVDTDAPDLDEAEPGLEPALDELSGDPLN
jgi:hypothetical protein